MSAQDKSKFSKTEMLLAGGFLMGALSIIFNSTPMAIFGSAVIISCILDMGLSTIAQMIHDASARQHVTARSPSESPSPCNPTEEKS